MATVLQILGRDLETDLRRRLVERVEVMVRQIRYLEETQNPRLDLVKRQGWSIERLEVICTLNSFYQLVLGPLASSAREEGGRAFGAQVPILYGEKLRFDEDRSAEIRSAHYTFMQVVNSLGVFEALLTANHASDVIFLLAGSIETDVG